MALEVLRQQLTVGTFQQFFAPLRLIDEAENTIRVATHDDFLAMWITSSYSDIIQDAINQVAGSPQSFKIIVREEPKALMVMELCSDNPDISTIDLALPDELDLSTHLDTDSSASLNGTSSALTAGAGDSTGEWTINTPESNTDEWIDYSLNPNYTFDRFVVGPTNELGYAASRSVAENPSTSYNPLFIYGGTGLGKTHLLHAIAHRIRTTRPNARIVYVSAEEFTNHVIRSIQSNEMARFRERYRSQCDVLLVDDIQFLARKDRTQEEFFHTFNALRGAGRQIVLTSDTTPQEIPHLEERLRSRFTGGLIADIKAPQLETRVAILHQKARSEGIVLPDDVAFFIARVVQRNVRELEGALTRVTMMASFSRRQLSVDYARQALDDLLDENASVLTIDLVIRLVAEHFNLKPSDLRGAQRSRAISAPRAMAMYLARRQINASFPQIGRGFGGRDHTTVMAACKKIEKAMRDDPAVRAEVETLLRKLPD